MTTNVRSFICFYFSCPFDYLLVKDGLDKDYSEDIGVFCGKYKDVTLFSSREFLYMEFVTRSGRVSFDKDSLDNSADFKFERKGFNIAYEFSDRFVHLGKCEISSICFILNTVSVMSTSAFIITCVYSVSCIM